MALRHVLGPVTLLGFVAACAAAGDDGIAGGESKPSSEAGPAPFGGSIDAGGLGDNTSCTPGTTRACYDGPPETRNVGICHEGTQTCLASGEFGAWGECTGAITPDDTATGSCECTPEHADAGLPDLSSGLCGETHTECECGMAGGTLVDIGESCRICRFDAAVCPDSWQNYDNWRTTVDGDKCGVVEQIAPTGQGGAAEDCPPLVPAVKSSQGTFLLSCDRENNYCCGSPPDANALQTHGKAWSSHVPDEKTFNQGVNVCGCACGSEHCQVKQLSCVAPTTQIGCS